MKGDFSFVGIAPDTPYTGVRHQQGRVLLDRDWNDAQEIDALWRRRAAADTFGAGVLAVPATSAEAFQVMAATQEGDAVTIQLAPGRAWAGGVPVRLPASATFEARYLQPPLVPQAFTADSIAPGVRDAVVLEVFEDTVSGFQDPSQLVEPALGGPDTTGRVQAFHRLRLMRLGPNEDCRAVAGLVDDGAGLGRLSVTPSPALVIAGDCPLEAGGGYTGLEHLLYRIEIASPSATGAARFKWSQFNGGLVGRGLFTPGTAAGTGTLTLTANDQAINTCGLARFYLEALAFDAARGTWEVVFSADAERSVDGVLDLAATTGAWPGVAGASGFFRLWNGIAEVGDFAAAAPKDFEDGLQLQFTPPVAGNANYRPGDYWTFPVRAGGASFYPPLWPIDALPAGVTHWRVALAEITWQAAPGGGAAEHSADWQRGEIEDCRSIFQPLTRQKVCCSYLVGDGKTSFGDFNSLELALRHLPAAGGEICLLPGLHTANAVIRNRANITLRGCGARTRLLPRPDGIDQPIVTILDSTRVEVEHIDFVALGGPALWVEGSRAGLCEDVVLTRHRILACTHAVFARRASQLQVTDNRIRMLDRAEGGAALDLAGRDLLVERNDIALVPAERTPPVNPGDPQDPVDPVDPCLRFTRLYALPRVLGRYLGAFWALELPVSLFLGLKQPYLAPGGIQLRGGCERVRVRRNRVTGGRGHGITLGTQLREAGPPAEPAPEFRFRVRGGDARVRGRVLGPDGKPLPGVQVTVTRSDNNDTHTETASAPDGEFLFGLTEGEWVVTEGATGHDIDKMDSRELEQGRLLLMTLLLKEVAPPPAQEEDGFLYDITLDDNEVRAMGLSAIGVPLPQLANPDGPILLRAFDARARARALLGWPVVGLDILGNRLTHNLRNPFDANLRAWTQGQGLGGVSLGLVDRLRLAGNRIEGNGRSGADPACGLFLQYGEAAEVSHNHVIDNGTLPSANAPVQPGQRGGLVLGLVADFGLFARLRRNAEGETVASAARILGNHVEQPVGASLAARVFGEAMVNDNVLASQRSGVDGLDALVGAVRLSNLAGVSTAALPVRVSTAALEPAAAEEVQPVAALTRLGARNQPLLVNVERAALLPRGGLMFNANQVRAGAAHTAPVTCLVAGYDDLGFEGNQCRSEQTGRVYANTVLAAATLRATGNRLREAAGRASLSLLTIASRANNTSFNQGDHCIVAQDTDPAPPATVQTGNQVLQPGPVCNRFNMITALLFKPLNA